MVNQRYIQADIQITVGAPIHVARQSFCSPHPQTRTATSNATSEAFFPHQPWGQNDEGGEGQKKN